MAEDVHESLERSAGFLLRGGGPQACLGAFTELRQVHPAVVDGPIEVGVVRRHFGSELAKIVEPRLRVEGGGGEEGANGVDQFDSLRGAA